MTESIVKALIEALPYLILSIVTIVVNNRLVIYRIDQLEKQVKERASISERVVIIEQKMVAAFNRIDELRDDLKVRLNGK